ncbi:hypothetical protein EDD22DRAFT_949209 [Suillus occidentalis]|nr:hypothetical protein EDD22DRAFT_949209 [Suillus occidentalis]
MASPQSSSMLPAGEFDVNEPQDGSRSAMCTNSEDEQHQAGLQQKDSNDNAAEASLQARQRRRIAQLEEKLQVLESGHAVKEKQTNYYMAQGRAIRRIVTLFDNIEDLICENDRRCEAGDDDDTTSTNDQDRLQVGFATFTNTMRWFHKTAVDMEYDDYLQLLKSTLVSEWINREFKPDPPVDPDDKNSRGFTNDACGRLLCPAELNWSDPGVRAGIRDRSDGYIVTDLSFPAFMYEKYTANPDDLEEGLFKGKILVQGYKAVFTSPSSAKDTECDGDGADIIQNNRRARNPYCALKVKKHVAQIIRMEKVTPRSLAYIACQVRFALSSVTSWRSVDGDFDYVQFWRTLVDFFEKAPGREARRRVDRLLEWWTRKVFGRSRREDLSKAAKASMSVNALATQRAQRDDVLFDSP